MENGLCTFTNHDHVSFLIASMMTIVFLAAPCDGDEDSVCYETIKYEE
jgi:hypothetical protein